MKVCLVLLMSFSCVVAIHFFALYFIGSVKLCIGISHVGISIFNTDMTPNLRTCRFCEHKCVMSHPAPISSPHQARRRSKLCKHKCVMSLLAPISSPHQAYRRSKSWKHKCIYHVIIMFTNARFDDAPQHLRKLTRGSLEQCF